MVEPAELPAVRVFTPLMSLALASMLLSRYVGLSLVVAPSLPKLPTPPLTVSDATTLVPRILPVAPSIEMVEPAGVQPQENAEAARPEATVQKNPVKQTASEPETAEDQPVAVGAARRIEPSRMHGLDREERLRRSDTEERWVLPASIEVKD